MVPDAWLPRQSEEAGSKDRANKAYVEKPIVVSASTKVSGGLPLKNSSNLTWYKCQWGRSFCCNREYPSWPHGPSQIIYAS